MAADDSQDAVPLRRDPYTFVWAALVTATVVSWWVGSHHAFAGRVAGGSLVLLLAFVKARFIGSYFMELRHAPLPLRLLFDTWCVGVCGLVIGMLLLGLKP